MTEGSATRWTAGIAAALAAVLSVGRILLSNGSALTDLIWAEDGMFPLCVRGHGVLACMTDPFAGYFLFLPRLLAWPISLLPIDSWPLATNLVAAAIAAGAAAVAVLILRSSGVGIVTSGFVGLLPVLVPISGLEMINAVGSMYMLLAFIGALALCFPPRDRFPTAAYAIGALLVALTIPSSVVLLLPLVVQLARKRIPLRGGLITLVSLVAGLAVQAIVAVTAVDPRRIAISTDSLREWANGVPNALLTLLPGQSALNDDGTLTASVSVGVIGLIVVVLVLVGGVVLIALRDKVANGLGLLVLVGLAMGAIPALSGYANNRYFVIPVVIWTAAALIALDHYVPGRKELVMAVAAVVLVALWIPSLPASKFRSTALPPWPQTIAEAQTSCANDPNATVAIVFSPAWPFSDAKWYGVTSNLITCLALEGR